MKILARCTLQAWDSSNCFMFFPGHNYTIDSDGPLASMRHPNDASKFVFEFDRALAANQKPKVTSIA
jgi:hypothetical protein